MIEPFDTAHCAVARGRSPKGTMESRGDAPPWTAAFGQFAPGRPRLRQPEQGVEDQAVIRQRSARARFRQERLQAGPSVAGELVTPVHGAVP